MEAKSQMQTQYDESLEDFTLMLKAFLSSEGYSKDATLICGYVGNAVEKLILDTGIVKLSEKLITVIDKLADIPVANIKDNALKKTIRRIAQDTGVRVSEARDFVHKLNAGNVEVAARLLYEELQALEHDHATATRISHQYDAMKVPPEMTARLKELRDKMSAVFDSFPHLKEIICE